MKGGARNRRRSTPKCPCVSGSGSAAPAGTARNSVAPPAGGGFSGECLPGLVMSLDSGRVVVGAGGVGEEGAGRCGGCGRRRRGGCGALWWVRAASARRVRAICLRSASTLSPGTDLGGQTCGCVSAEVDRRAAGDRVAQMSVQPVECSAPFAGQFVATIRQQPEHAPVVICADSRGRGRPRSPTGAQATAGPISTAPRSSSGMLAP